MQTDTSPDRNRAIEMLDIQRACGNEEAHAAHMTMNGECPWCGAYTDEVAAQLGLPPFRLEQPATTRTETRA